MPTSRPPDLSPIRREASQLKHLRHSGGVTRQAPGKTRRLLEAMAVIGLDGLPHRVDKLLFSVSGGVGRRLADRGRDIARNLASRTPGLGGDSGLRAPLLVIDPHPLVHGRRWTRGRRRLVGCRTGAADHMGTASCHRPPGLGHRTLRATLRVAVPTASVPSRRTTSGTTRSRTRRPRRTATRPTGARATPAPCPLCTRRRLAIPIPRVPRIGRPSSSRRAPWTLAFTATGGACTRRTR